MSYLGILVVIFLLVTSADGADKNNKKDDPFWCNLQNKVQKLTPTKKTTATLAVAGVKGAKNEAADLYWKGREKRLEIGEDEILKFNIAVESQSKGNYDQALQLFEAFIKEFPKSSLRTEGVQAVEMLKGEVARQTPKEATAAPPPVSQSTAPTAVIPTPQEKAQ